MKIRRASILIKGGSFYTMQGNYLHLIYEGDYRTYLKTYSLSFRIIKTTKIC